MDKNKITAGTISRTIILIVALINQLLTALGKSVLPFSEEQMNEAISVLFTIITAMVAWWHNNSFTQAALAGDKVMNAIKAEEEASEDA